MRLYIVDDDAQAKDPIHKKNFHSNTVEYLQLLGHIVHVEAYLEKAYEHLIDPSNRFKYDLIVIDHHFYSDFQSGKFINGNTEEEKDNGTGAFICGELSKHNLPTPIILFTATGKDADNIRKVLGDYGICYFFEKREFKKTAIDKVLTLPGFKRIWIIRQNEIEKELNNYFKKLTSDERELMRKNALWYLEKKEVKIKKGKYLLKDLFFNPNQATSKTFLTSQLLKYLNKNEVYVFDGEYLGTIEYNKAIEEYKNNSEYDSLKKQIDLDALNYLLDVLFVLDNYKNADDDKVHTLNERNRRYKATKHKKKVTLEVLKEKLILRRVALGSDILNIFVEKIVEELKSEDMEAKTNYKKVIAGILRDGDTSIQTQTEYNKSFNPTHVFYYGLGLISDRNDRTYYSFDTQKLQEEIFWINHFTKAAKFIRCFLDTAHQDEVFSTFIDKNQTFSDLEDFWEHVKNRKISHGDRKEFDSFIGDIKEYFEANTNEHTSKLISEGLREIHCS